MPRRIYGDVSFDVPASWQDNTIVSLILPEPEQTNLPRVKQTKSEQASVVLTRADATGLVYDVEQYAKAQEKILAEIMEGLEVLERGSVSIGDGEAAFTAVTRRCKFNHPEGGVVEQMHAYFRLGDTMFAMTATGSHDVSFTDVELAFGKLLGSVRSG